MENPHSRVRIFSLLWGWYFQPFIPAAIQDQPGNKTVTHLTRQAILRGFNFKIPTLVFNQGPKAINERNTAAISNVFET
jgi:hypothetical protein